MGYPCIFPHNRQDAGGLYFVGSSQPVLRLVSLFVNPGSIAGTATADLPNGAAWQLGPTVPAFDPNDPTTVYTALGTNGGSVGLFKIHYTGNWSALNIAFQANSVNAPRTTELTWQNMTPRATGRDMRAKLANTTYDEAAWGALNGLQSLGTSGKYAAFERAIGAQESACWIFVFDSTTGNFYRAWRTDDGSSLGLKYPAAIMYPHWTGICSFWRVTVSNGETPACRTEARLRRRFWPCSGTGLRFDQYRAAMASGIAPGCQRIRHGMPDESEPGMDRQRSGGQPMCNRADERALFVLSGGG